MATTKNTLELAEHLAHEQLGARIAVAREQLGLSPEQLARRIGIRPGTLALWEKGSREPRANQLVTLAGILEVSTPWLLEGREDRFMESASEHPTTALRGKVTAAKGALAELSQRLEEIEAALDDLDQEV